MVGFVSVVAFCGLLWSLWPFGVYVWESAPSFFPFLRWSLGSPSFSSPPFRLALTWSTVLFREIMPTFPLAAILLCLICLSLETPFGYLRPSPFSSPPFRLALMRGSLFLPSTFSSYLSSSSGRPARRIQSDSDPMWSALAASPPVAAMERSKVICSIQVCWRKLGSQQEGLLWPFSEDHWAPCWLARCYCDRREISFLFLLPSLSSLEERLGCLLKARISLLISSTCYFSPPSFGRILRALELIFALPTHWEPLTVSLTSHLLDDFHTVVWLGLATCWRRTSERIWVLARCMLSSLVSLGFTKSWVG